jgi:signal transduction histidine kinase
MTISASRERRLLRPKRFVERLNAVNRLGHLVRSGDLQSGVEAIANTVALLFPDAAVSVHRLAPEKQALVLCQSCRLPEALSNSLGEISLSQADAFGHAILTGNSEFVSCQSPGEYPLSPSLFLAARANGLELVGILPTADKQSALASSTDSAFSLGCLCLWQHSLLKPDKDDLALLDTLNGHLATALQNDANSQERKHLAQLHMISEIGKDIISILSVDELLSKLVHLLKDVFKQYCVNILLLDARTGELRWRVGTRFASADLVPARFACLQPDEGICGWVAQHSEPLLANDVLKEPRYLPVPELPDTRSELAVPIMLGKSVLGVLDVQDSKRDAYDREDLSIFQTFASQIAAALENARLFEQAQQRVMELSTLRQVSMQLISSVDLPAVLNMIAESALHLVGATDIQTYLYDERTKEFSFGAALWSGGERKMAVEAPHATGLTARVAVEARPIVIDNVKQHPLFQDAANSDKMQAIAGFPLMRGNKILGVFNVAFDSPHHFSEDELRALNLLADQAALGIERARLFEELNHRIDQLSSLYHMAQQTTGSLSLEKVLDTIVSELRTVISCRAICIFLLDEATQELSIAAATGLKPEFRDRTRLKIGEGVSGLVFQQVRPIYVKNIPQDAPDLHTDPAIRSLLVVPLLAKSKIIGTLSIDSTEISAFAASDERLLTIAAAQAASAIENAQLFQAEKKRAEELRVAYEGLKQLDRLKSQFVQNISHELRTPLTFIKGYVDLLANELMGPLTSGQKQSLEVVQRKTDAIIRLVNEIITLQELEALPMTKSLTSLGELLRMVVAAAEPTAASVGLRLCTQIPDHKMWIMADDDRLIQVFDNLLGNAIKFSPNGGTITISIQDGDQAGTEAESLVVAIHDTGIGIPADKLEKVFERFYQVDGSTTRRFGGTGLGLAIAKEIVTAHNGRIWAESTLGQGSTFYVSLPRRAGL